MEKVDQVQHIWISGQYPSFWIILKEAAKHQDFDQLTSTTLLHYFTADWSQWRPQYLSIRAPSKGRRSDQPPLLRPLPLVNGNEELAPDITCQLSTGLAQSQPNKMAECRESWPAFLALLQIILELADYRGDFPDGSVGKESVWNAGDTGDVGSIPGLGRSPGRGNGNPLQYSCLKKPMERVISWAIAQRAAKSQTRLSDSAPPINN